MHPPPTVSPILNLLTLDPTSITSSTKSSTIFEVGKNHDSVNQNCSFTRSSVIDYSLLSPHSNNPLFGAGQLSDGDLKTTGVRNGYSGPGSISPSVSSCSINADNGANRRRSSESESEGEPMTPRLKTHRKKHGHVSAGHGRIGTHSHHPGGRGNAGGMPHHHLLFDQYHPGSFGKVGMRSFPRLRPRFYCPIVHIWSLVPQEIKDKASLSPRGLVPTIPF
ncbi:unnamed protein product [Camellia sinensis]